MIMAEKLGILVLPNGETRAFLEDGDEVIMTAKAHAKVRRSIGFGTCSAVVRPIREPFQGGSCRMLREERP
jgi:hypothetical protein